MRGPARPCRTTAAHRADRPSCRPAAPAPGCRAACAWVRVAGTSLRSWVRKRSMPCTSSTGKTTAPAVARATNRRGTSGAPPRWRCDRLGPGGRSENDRQRNTNQQTAAHVRHPQHDTVAPMRQRMDWTQIRNLHAYRCANCIPLRVQPKDDDRLRVGGDGMPTLGLRGPGEMLGRGPPEAGRRRRVEQAAGGRRKYRTVAAMDVARELCARLVAMDPRCDSSSRSARSGACCSS